MVRVRAKAALRVAHACRNCSRISATRNNVSNVVCPRPGVGVPTILGQRCSKRTGRLNAHHCLSGVLCVCPP